MNTYPKIDTCGTCGQAATGFASIGDTRHCHVDSDPSPTCYQSALQELVDTAIAAKLERIRGAMSEAERKATTEADWHNHNRKNPSWDTPT